MATPPDAHTAGAGSPRGINARLGLMLVLLACAVAYWPRLGATGLSMSEGHRILPAWEMLDRGEWLVPRLFGQVYLRKPPGMPWAVAASSMLLGRTEFAARAVSAASATLMALVAFAFAARWYGPRWGAGAGLASALMPLFWESGRSAEIEALNNLGTQVALLAMLDLLVFRAVRGAAPARAGLMTVLAAAGLTIAGLAKGPASGPCFVGAVIGACVVVRSWRPLFSPLLWGASLAAGVVLALVAWRIRTAVGAEHKVTQAPSDFLWSSERLSFLGVLDVLKLGPESLVLALPVSLALLYPWGSSARLDAGRSDSARAPWMMARSIAWTCLLSLVLLTAIGVGNPRYTLPAMTIAPLLVPYVFSSVANSTSLARRLSARVGTLWHPGAWPAILLAGAIGYIVFQERQRDASSGRESGEALAGVIPDGAVVWADGVIEARPEVLHYAVAAAARGGRRVTARWLPGLHRGLELPAPGAFVLLRRDEMLSEMAAFERAGLRDRLVPLADGRVHKFDFVLCRVTE